MRDLQRSSIPVPTSQAKNIWFRLLDVQVIPLGHVLMAADFFRPFVSVALMQHLLIGCSPPVLCRPVCKPQDPSHEDYNEGAG